MEKEVYLTPQEIDSMASKMSDMREDIELITKAIDFIPSADSERVQENPLFMYKFTHSFLESLFQKLSNIEREIDWHAFILGCASNQEELNSARKKGNEIKVTNTDILI